MATKKATKKERTVNFGIIGLGPRAEVLLAALLHMDAVEVTAICDVNDAAIEKILGIFKKAGKDLPVAYKDYHQLIADQSVEAVLVPTSWNSHLPIAAAAMEAGKYVGIEVGGAASIDELWKLVHAAEKTGVSCMMLENCCYGRNEMMVMNMVRKGMFGEIVHCEGGYEHDLRDLARSLRGQQERALHNKLRNGDIYPTHQLGPIAKVLDINRGNRFLSLTSTASKACGFKAASREHYKDEPYDSPAHKFNMGDVITTVIKCANGETITMTHSISLPRPYSRNARVQGTKGIWLEDANGIHIEGISKVEVKLDPAGNPYETHLWDPVEKFYKKYDHPLWKEYMKKGLVGGHGGFDGLTLMAFANSVRKGIPTPIDVYDVATWMAMTCLSEQSIAIGSGPVPFPDFTNGKWVTRTRDTSCGNYSL